MICMFVLSFNSLSSTNATDADNSVHKATQRSSQSLDNRNIQIEQLTTKNLDLETRIRSLEHQLGDIHNYDKIVEPLSVQKSKIDYSTWISFLLASVAIILTILGIVIAIFSFVGYQKVLASSKKIARKTAKEAVKQSINDTTYEELKYIFSEEGIDDDDNEAVRKFLLEAVSKIIYRGIGLDENWQRDEDKSS